MKWFWGGGFQLPEVRKENSENNQISIFGSNKKPKA
jgi:hypothetical protein